MAASLGEVHSVKISSPDDLTPAKSKPDIASSASNEKNPRDAGNTGKANTAAQLSRTELS